MVARAEGVAVGVGEGVALSEAELVLVRSSS